MKLSIKLTIPHKKTVLWWTHSYSMQSGQLTEPSFKNSYSGRCLCWTRKLKINKSEETKCVWSLDVELYRFESHSVEMNVSGWTKVVELQLTLQKFSWNETQGQCNWKSGYVETDIMFVILAACLRSIVLELADNVQFFSLQVWGIFT